MTNSRHSSNYSGTADVFVVFYQTFSSITTVHSWQNKPCSFTEIDLKAQDVLLIGKIILPILCMIGFCSSEVSTGLKLEGGVKKRAW